jgi:hypothetical protein
MVKRWGRTDKYNPSYQSLGIWDTIDTRNSAESPKCSQNDISKPFTMNKNTQTNHPDEEW